MSASAKRKKGLPSSPVVAPANGIPATTTALQELPSYPVEPADLAIGLRVWILFLALFFGALIVGAHQYDNKFHLFGKHHPDSLQNSAVKLPFYWFDKILRVVGPLFPFAILALRWAVSRSAPRAARLEDAQCAQMLLVYIGLSGTRLVIYGMHQAGLFAFLVAVGSVSAVPAHLMADHSFLSSSLITMFASETYHHLRAIRRSTVPGRRHRWHRLVLGAGLGACVVLTVLICGDMYYTSRYFHAPRETVWAALLGLVLFQLPMAWWQLYGRDVGVAVGEPERVIQMRELGA